MVNREKVISFEKHLQELNPTSPKLYLNLGCGERLWRGWKNIDLYSKDPNVIKMDIMSPCYPSNSVEYIYSSHSLEHLPIRQAIQALKNWYDILELGGTLVLMVPDLEQIMRNILNKDLPFLQRYCWYLHTLYGWQTNMNNSNPNLDAEIDYGQFHQTGFTEEYLEHHLNSIGYTIIESFKYDGYGTPSLFYKAVK